MKNYLVPAVAALCALAANSQTINFSNGPVTYSFPAEITGEMNFADRGVTVAGRQFQLSEWSGINVDDSEVKDNTVTVIYASDKASVTIAGNIAPYVDARVSGAHVELVQSEEVGDATCGEITYVLEGESADGSFVLEGSYKATLELRGLSLENPSGAAIDILNGKRIELSAKNGTTNYLADGDGSQKGAINCKGHLELKGKGALTVEGRKSHAIYAKEYVEIKNLTLDITGAVKDGINCGQYFMMESGTVTIAGTGDDGIQAAYKDDANREEEDTGSITVKGGTLNVTVSADATKCLKADGDIAIADGTLTLVTNANGLWDSSKSKVKASACIGADGGVIISGGTLDLKATGSGGKGISCDGTFTGEGGKVTIATTGGLLVYSNGTLNHDYTGNAERINSDYKSSAKGIKADSGLVINDGEYHITTSTNNAEGIESKKDLDINGGTIFVKAYDDGINSANDFRVSGGDLTVISIVGDGLDSNANLTISGGFVRTMGSGGMEMGLDAATETGGAVYITGGTLMAFGGSNTYPTRSGSTQAFVRTTGSIKAGTEISVKAGDETILTFTVPAEYNSSTSGPQPGPGGGPGGGGWNPGGGSGSGSLMISCPEMSAGNSYTVVNDATSTTVTAVLTSSGR